jgi:hypothetical protein
VDAMLYSASTFFQVVQERLVTLAARHSIPAIYEWPEFVMAGGLMSYSSSRSEAGQSYRADPQGCEARRFAHRAIEQVRAGHQHEDREGAGPHHPAGRARNRRRGDRISVAASTLFAAVHESGCGRFCCKSLFALAIKISLGCARDFRVKMWGPSSPEGKLAGDLGNVIEATSTGGRRSVFLQQKN